MLDQSSSGDDFWNQFPVHDGTTELGGTSPMQGGSPDSSGLINHQIYTAQGSTSGDPTMAPPPPAPAQTGGTTAPTSGQPWDQNYFSTNFGTPKTPAELVALESKITAAGGKVLRNAAGVAGKIQTPDGRIIDVINSAGAGGNGFQWLDGGGGSGGGSNLGSLGYQFGDAMQKFTPPTADDALKSPGLEFALGEANRMAQNGAAAKGTLLNGRFQQALSASNIGNALQGYGDVYNRAFQTFTRNQDAPFQKQLSLAQLGKPGTSQ